MLVGEAPGRGIGGEPYTPDIYDICFSAVSDHSVDFAIAYMSNPTLGLPFPFFCPLIHSIMSYSHIRIRLCAKIFREFKQLTRDLSFASSAKFLVHISLYDSCIKLCHTDSHIDFQHNHIRTLYQARSYQTHFILWVCRTEKQGQWGLGFEYAGTQFQWPSLNDVTILWITHLLHAWHSVFCWSASTVLYYSKHFAGPELFAVLSSLYSS